MNQVFAGLRVVEVAQYVFVPACGAILADYGASVIKVEPPGKGDPYRGLVTSAAQAEHKVNIIFELNNRGKRSVALDLKHPRGLEVLQQLVAAADVFLTNLRPAALERLKLDADQLCRGNPSLIYARGHGFGRRGPAAQRPGYDATAFWARSGFAHLLTPPEAREPVRQRPAFGDHIGAMNLAMGIASALYARERTGKGAVIDVSLLGSGMWVLSSDLVQCRLPGYQERHERERVYNPLTNTFRTRDGRWIQLILLESQRYWPELCARIGRPELSEDPRFADAQARARNCADCVGTLDEAFARCSLAEWIERLRTFDAPWEPVQTLQDIFADPQAEANDYFFELEADDGRGYSLVAAPVEFNESPVRARRAPRLGEHTEEVLRELGVEAQQIEELRKVGTIG